MLNTVHIVPRQPDYLEASADSLQLHCRRGNKLTAAHRRRSFPKRPSVDRCLSYPQVAARVNYLPITHWVSIAMATTRPGAAFGIAAEGRCAARYRLTISFNTLGRYPPRRWAETQAESGDANGVIVTVSCPKPPLSRWSRCHWGRRHMAMASV